MREYHFSCYLRNINRLTLLKCDDIAMGLISQYEGRNFSTGYVTSCSRGKDVSGNRACSGIGYCQAATPRGLMTFLGIRPRLKQSGYQWRTDDSFWKEQELEFSCYKLAPIHDIAKTLLLVVKYLHNCGLKPMGMTVDRWSLVSNGLRHWWLTGRAAAKKGKRRQLWWPLFFEKERVERS
ncbi:hypothetical protein FXO37_32868 [Capsicum annuum]|nr:hypothetical protein FXO37_32868 [Capsicum annuum]